MNELQTALGATKRCMKRVLKAERLITNLLEAWDDSEHGNVEEALQKLREFIQEI